MSFGEEGAPGAYHTNALHTLVAPYSIQNTLRGPDPSVLNGLGPVLETTFPFSAGMHRFNKDAAVMIARCEAGSQRLRILQAWLERPAKVRVSMGLLIACCEDQNFPYNSFLSGEIQISLILIMGKKLKEEKGEGIG